MCHLELMLQGDRVLIGTNCLRFSLSEVNPDKPFHKTEWQSFVGTSHFCKLKMNLTSSSGWRLKLLTTPMQPLVRSPQHS